MTNSYEQYKSFLEEGNNFIFMSEEDYDNNVTDWKSKLNYRCVLRNHAITISKKQFAENMHKVEAEEAPSSFCVKCNDIDHPKTNSVKYKNFLKKLNTNFVVLTTLEQFVKNGGSSNVDFKCRKHGHLNSTTVNALSNKFSDFGIKKGDVVPENFCSGSECSK